MQLVNLYTEDDTALLLQLNEGSRDAFDVLYDKYWKQVFNAAYKRVNDKDIAQDIAQDVFVQLWIRGTKTLIENLPAYLFVAARNGVFKRMEKEGRYADLPDTVEQLENPLDRADSNVLHQEFLNAFNKLIDTLPEQQRVIFKLRFFESLSSSQIADQLQISPKTVRNQIGKALATLRTELVFQVMIIIILQKYE